MIELRGVTKAYRTNAVLRGIDLRVDTHEVVALIGPSGSGKSTILKCINGLERVDAGQVVVDGIDLSQPGADLDRARRRVGIVFQSFNLFPHLCVLDNVTLAPRRVLFGAGRRRRRRRRNFSRGSG